MAGTKILQFDPSNLYNLLVHYTDGGCPMNGVVKDVLVHPALSRFIALNVESDEWEDPNPLHIRYDGERTMTWAKGEEKGEWAQREETPKRQ